MRIHDASGRADHTDILVAPDRSDWIIAPNAVTDPKLRDSTALSVIGRASNTVGDPADIIAAGDKSVLHQDGVALAFSTIDHTYISDFDEAVGDVIGATFVDSAEINFIYDDPLNTITAELNAASVTFAKLQNIATSRILGRTTAGSGSIESLTGTQATAVLDVFTSALKGLAPASGGGTANYLRADGTWAAPPGTGGAVGANPTASVGLTAVNGVATTFLRSDGAPALNQGITPTWTGKHTFSVALDGALVRASADNAAGLAGPGLELQWDAAAVTSRLASYNRTSNAYQPLSLDASVITIAVGDLEFSSGRSARWGHANQVDANDGKINAGVFSDGLNIIGVQTIPAAGRLITTYGSFFFRSSTGTLRFTMDGTGRLSGTALHNNASLPTGTVNQYIASGTYTPTLTNVGNATSLSADPFQWIRVGNVVTVSGRIFAAASAAGPSMQVGITLPIASGLTVAYQCAGVSRAEAANGFTGVIYADTTNDRANMSVQDTPSTATVAYYLTFTYLIL